MLVLNLLLVTDITSRPTCFSCLPIPSMPGVNLKFVAKKPKIPESFQVLKSLPSQFNYVRSFAPPGVAWWTVEMEVELKREVETLHQYAGLQQCTSEPTSSELPL